MNNDNPRRNAEGYLDQTAYEALKPIIREEERQRSKISELMHIINAAAKLAGFRLYSRIEFEDMETGKVYR